MRDEYTLGLLCDYEDMLAGVLNDLKYLNRLNNVEFAELLFPHATGEYLTQKWYDFKTNPLGFLWSCDLGRIRTIGHYIRKCKWGDE
jgi:hypothetical protein